MAPGRTDERTNTAGMASTYSFGHGKRFGQNAQDILQRLFEIKRLIDNATYGLKAGELEI